MYPVQPHTNYVPQMHSKITQLKKTQSKFTHSKITYPKKTKCIDDFDSDEDSEDDNAAN